MQFDARAQLPDEWNPLFEAGATGEMVVEE